ncbi:hypothetical protein DYB37_006325 [Aphanomyces astaci]|uniref:Uncharacterized protein n=1 Tax=Aphanomyces astaci TaxID=112090 RepID=A0A3R7ABC0_APHAT|nr:hypothetical protein DYB37_006325 [Aphanomyces astaci]
MAGVAYAGEPKQTGGLNKLIELSAIESDLIADCMEWGWGLRETTHMVNQLRFQIVSWDETHKEVKIGGYGVNGSKRQVRFRRDVNGKVDPNGELAATKSFLNMKYTNQAKFCFGCAIVDDGNGGVVGLRCNPFLYSGNWIRTINEFEQLLQQQEIRRVKALEGKGLPWFQGTHQDRW